jgi:hypothetical protein
MNESLDVRRAIREANSVFSRFPVQVCLPMLLLGLVSYATLDRLQPAQNHYFLIGMVESFCICWLDCFAQVVVASMCLRAWEGSVPGASQASEVLRYRGFGSLIWGLIFRYLGWILLLSLIGGAIGAVAAILSLVIHSAVAPANGISAFAGGVHIGGIAIGAIAAIVILVLILSRYVFVLPMFAIARASRPGFLDECVVRTKQVWKAATLVLVIGGAPAFLLVGIEFLVWKEWQDPTPPHGVHLAVHLVGALLIDCYAAWLILVKTGLAQQLMSLPLPANIPPPPDPAGVVNRIGPPPL